MKYSLKTGRLKFEAADFVVRKRRAQKMRRKVKMPLLRIERPVSDEKTIDSLNKQLCRHIITFDTKKQLSSVARILSGIELFTKFKRTMVQATAVFMMLILVLEIKPLDDLEVVIHHCNCKETSHLMV